MSNRHTATTGKASARAPEVLSWFCTSCEKECIQIREESRCLCGHRLKEHEGGRKCKSARCGCRHFNYMVAEGAWIIRCRCKHKHIDHDPAKKPHACTRNGCKCTAFDSPFVCNCGCGWALHVQKSKTREQGGVFGTMQDLASLAQEMDPYAARRGGVGMSTNSCSENIPPKESIEEGMIESNHLTGPLPVRESAKPVKLDVKEGDFRAKLQLLKRRINTK